MKLSGITLCCLVAVFIIVSCKKTTNPAIINSVISKINADVYVGGYSFTTQNIAVATYWKNGVEYKVQDSSKSSQASAIGLIGEDVYLAGTEFSTLSAASYWKNGVAFNLGGNNSAVTSMCINGPDIYILGSVDSGTNYSSIVYWKNGLKTTVTNGSSQAAGYSINVNNSDVYIAGFSEKSNHSPIASYWKNGMVNTLANDTVYSTANAIAVNGSNIYVAGTVGGNFNTVATRWKNGIAVPLSSAGPDTYLDSITFNGGDIYTAGSLPLNAASPTVTDQAVYWKNGIETKLSFGTLSAGFAIATNGSDVYVAGDGIAANGNQVPVYWRNRVPVQLSNHGVATSIVIISH